MITLEKLQQLLNENFGEPFLVKNGVVAELHNENGVKELSINIGRRDVTIDENGDVVGCGTFVGMADDTLVFDDEV